MDRVDTMRIAVGAADRLVGALEAGAWPDDRTPGGTFLAALVDLTAGPAGPSHPFERQGVVRALGECREHIESVTSDDPPDTTAVRERAAWAHSVFYQRMDGDADAVTDLQRLLDEHPQAVAVPASSAGVLEECLRWALYWKGSTARQEGQLRDAEQWYRLALDAGQLAARNELANVLDDLGQARAAKALWTTAARDGDANAASNLGAYYDRLGDMSESEAWFRRATDLGHLDASVRLGQRLYHRGERAEAERLWRRGAAEGLGDACEFLGILLLERDDVEGAHLWLEKAANEGHAGSCRQLAALYERLGRRKKTIEWLRTAALNGHPTAAEELHRLTSDDPFVAAEQHAAEELLRLSKSGPLVGRAANEFIAAATREQNRQADEAKQRRRRKGKG